MKLAQLQTITVSAASAAALDTAIAAAVKGSGEATFLDLRLAVDAGTYVAVLVYTR